MFPGLSEAELAQAPVVKRRVAVPDGTKGVGAQDQPALSRPQSDDLEARIEATDTSLAAMATEAYDEGDAAGFRRGYEQGIDAASKRPGAILEAKHEGVLAGRKQQAARTLALITEMRGQIKGKGPVEAHSMNCWQRHPMCAIDAIRKAQEIK
jgi:flagellar biosynthesis/type III secretory pathway protein FliH